MCRNIMLTGGNYIQTRQVILRFPSQFVKTMNRCCLKESIESAMNYLANHGYGKLQDKVFYKNPHLSEEQLKRILVEPQEYIKSLKFVGAGFSRQKGKYEACMKVYRQLYDSDNSNSQ